MVIEQQAQLRDELLEAGGNSLEAYIAAPLDGRAQMEEAGGQVWIEESNRNDAAKMAADSEQQAAVQTEFANRHKKHFPSEANGELFAATYAEAWQEANPGLPIFWEIGAMEALYNALCEQGAFEVERVYKQ